MKPEEMRAAGRLATRTLADTVGHVEHVHRAAASRVFALFAPASLPIRVLHDGIATGVYAAIRGVALAAGLAGSELVGRAAGSTVPAGSTPRSNLAMAVLNATLGNELADQCSPLAIQMAVRHARADVAPRREALDVAFPGATSKVAVFIHGLGETEESWRLHADRHGNDSESTYGSRLAHDLGFTPVYLRYNTGLHISESGKHLTALLDDVVAAWPTPVAELILVGHSMGGLVARSACHYAQQRSHSWASTLRHVFYLGTPHLGAGLEQWVSRLSGVLAKLDESRPLATVLDRRSAGIKDLHAGYLLDEDWQDADSGSCERHDVPLISEANHYAVSATVTTSRRNPLGRFVGDLLVQPASARGRSRRGGFVPFPAEHTRHFGRLHHFDLLNHPAVYEAMRKWLEPTFSAGSEVASTLAPLEDASGPSGSLRH
jgi:pimeloyl-ACP methyl ester carboxylesterase